MVLELSLNPPEPRNRNDIQPKVSTGRASVVNLPRSSFGSGEIIVRSRNSKRRPGRPLPKDYINAVSVSRRLRIGRCSLFPCRFEQTCGMPRGFSRLENVTIVKKFFHCLSANRVFVLREWENGKGRGISVGWEERWGEGQRKRARETVLFKFEDPRGWPGSSVAILEQTSFRSRLPFSSLHISLFVAPKMLLCTSHGKKDGRIQRMLALWRQRQVSRTETTVKA